MKKCDQSSWFPRQPEIPAGFCGITKSAMHLTVHDVYVYFQFQNGSPAVISVTLIDNSCSDAHVCTAAIAREQTPNLSRPCAEVFFSRPCGGFIFYFFLIKLSGLRYNQDSAKQGYLDAAWILRIISGEMKSL